MIEVLTKRAILHISGSDAQKFLQSMTTNNVIKNVYSYNYLLTNQGKYLFDFFVYKQKDDSYFLDIDAKSAENLSKRLTFYKLRNDVKIQDVSSLYSILYSKSPIETDNIVFSMRDTRYKDLGYRSMISNSQIDEMQDIAYGLYLSDKYKYAIIDGASDLIYDRSIPVEYGAEELNAIDYNKGCYVGQEVISRVKYQGVVRKKIFKLQFSTEISSELQGEDVLNIDGGKIGVICSNYKNQAISLLREEKFLLLESKTAMVGKYQADIVIPNWRN